MKKQQRTPCHHKKQPFALVRSSRSPSHEKTILVLALLGIFLSAYAVSLHYSPTKSRFCEINDVFSCDKVNKSPWSELFGIPVAVLGVLSYTAIFLFVLKRRTIERILFFSTKDFLQYLLFFFCVMLGFQIYLTLTEIFFIHAYCLVCIGSQTITLLLAIFGLRSYKQLRRTR